MITGEDNSIAKKVIRVGIGEDALCFAHGCREKKKEERENKLFHNSLLLFIGYGTKEGEKAGFQNHENVILSDVFFEAKKQLGSFMGVEETFWEDIE